MNIDSLYDFEVHLTTRCNMQCEFCAADVYRDEKCFEIDKNKIFQLIDRAKEQGNKRVTFSGGEPLLVKNLFSMIDYALNNGFTVNVSTNGLLINDEYIKFVADKKIATRISIHTLETDKFNDITKANVLERIIKNIKKLREQNSYYALTATIYDKNVDDIEQLGKFAFDHLANYIRFSPVYPCNLGEAYAASAEAIKQIIKSTALLVIKYYDQLEVTCHNADESIVDIMSTRRCLAEESRFSVITAEEQNKLCPFYPTDQELVSIAERKETFSYCKNCDYEAVCAGGCKALNNNRKGKDSFLCMNHIIKSAIADFSDADKQKLYNYWQGLYSEYSYRADPRIGCIRKLPIWELVFNKNMIRRARYGIN